MNDQVCFSRSSLVQYKMIKVKNRIESFKPFGGLWTSTYNEENGSDWVRWCMENDMPVTKVATILRVDRDAKVFEIDSYNDLKRCFAEYKMDGKNLGGYYEFLKISPRLDFEKMSLDYDGIHLTERGQAETRFSMPENLYGWDCESTIFFHWCFNDVRELVLKDERFVL